MKLKISSILNSTPEKIFSELQKPSLLQEVASPILKFKLVDKCQLPEKWEIEKVYTFNLYFLMYLYVGKHSISIKKIDYIKKQIISNEFGFLTKTWNHTIYVEEHANKKSHYTDEVEITADILTVFIWLFANLFYRHRQKRLGKIVEQL